MGIVVGGLLGFIGWFLLRFVGSGIYTVDQSERAVKTTFGRARRVEGVSTLDDHMAGTLTAEEQDRYAYPAVEVIPPGGPYWKWPWEEIYRVSVATQTLNMAFDPDDPGANRRGTILEAVTKDQLNTGLTGQLRYRVSERNLYAYLFGVKNPISHVMGFFISVLRERIANFEAPEALASTLPVVTFEHPATSGESGAPIGVSINDLRKNLRDINEHMDRECASSDARYGVVLEASLITSIDPPDEVEAALAAINTAHNQVSSDISLAVASADQKIVQSRRAVEIETLKAQAEVEHLYRMAFQLQELKKSGPQTLPAYLRNIRLQLLGKAQQIVMGVRR